MELSVAGRAANKEDWNKFLMAAKVRTAMSSDVLQHQSSMKCFMVAAMFLPKPREGKQQQTLLTNGPK